jgi:zinc transport system permease protein
MTNLLEILSYSFMQRAIVAGILLAISSPLIGIFLFSRRLSALTDTLSHVSLAGLVIGSVIGVLGEYNLIVAIFITIVISLIIDYIRQKELLPAEAILIVFVVLSLSIVSIIQSQFRLTRGLENLLFGSLLTVSNFDIVIIILFLIILFTFVRQNFWNLFITSVDSSIAISEGVNIKKLNFWLSLLTSIFCVLGAKLFGGLMISSLMIIPVSSAIILKFSFVNTIKVALIFSLISVLFGIILAWQLAIPIGASVAIINLLILFISFLIKEKVQL